MLLILLTALLSDVPPRNADRPANAPQTERAVPANIGPIPTSVAVTLECTAYADGHVADCSVLGETHPDMGFAEAAIALLQEEKLPPGPRDVRFARTIQFTP